MEKEWLIGSETAVYQDAVHRFTEDSLALVRFLRLHSGDRMLDLGTGNGILAIYGQALYGGRWTGIDLDETALELARRAAAENGQSMEFHRMDVAQAPNLLGHGSFDGIVCNPPYFTTGTQGARALMRHGTDALLSDWCRAAFLLLNNGGRMTLCYPADRLAVLFRALDQARLAPKRMLLLHTEDRARLALVEAKKLGGDGMEITSVCNFFTHS